MEVVVVLEARPDKLSPTNMFLSGSSPFSSYLYKKTVGEGGGSEGGGMVC